MEPLSPRNAEVARLRGLSRERRARHEAGRFIVEGPTLLLEALQAELVVLDVYVEDGWAMPADVAAAIETADVDVTVATTRAIERMASTSSPQPLVSEVLMPHADLGDLDPSRSILVTVDVNDPGNVGTLARSAVASGFDAIVCLGDTADPFSPKVIRSAAGALFRVPTVIERDARVGLERIGELGIARYGTRMVDAIDCDQQDLTGPVALVLGSEAHGLSGDLNASIDTWLSIPMPGNTESLNVAMAGTVLAYEVARQRRAE